MQTTLCCLHKVSLLHLARAEHAFSRLFAVLRQGSETADWRTVDGVARLEQLELDRLLGRRDVSETSWSGLLQR